MSHTSKGGPGDAPPGRDAAHRLGGLVQSVLGPAEALDRLLPVGATVTDRERALIERLSAAAGRLADYLQELRDARERE